MKKTAKAGAKNSPKGRKTAARGSPPKTDERWIQEFEQISRELPSFLKPEAVFRTIAARLVKKNGAGFAALWRLDPKQRLLRLAAQSGRKPSLPPEFTHVTLDSSLLGQAATRQKIQISSGKQSDPLANWARKVGFGYTAVYPMIYKKKVEGVLAVTSRSAPKAEAVFRFRICAQLAALAFHNTSAFSETEQSRRSLAFQVEAAKALSSTLDLSELLERILDVAKSQTAAERGTLYLVDRQTKEVWSLIAHGLNGQEIRRPVGEGLAGHVVETGEILNISDPYRHPRFNPELDQKFGFRTRNILSLPIRDKAGEIIAALQLLNKADGDFTAEDVEFLLTLSGHIGLAIENAQLHREAVEKQRMERELSVAQHIQNGLLPESVPKLEGFDIAVLNQPSLTVGGDYYDFLNLGPQTMLTVVADVQGKGVSSALIMSNLQATLRTLVDHVHSLEKIAESLNRLMMEHTRSERFLSIFLGLIDIGRRKIHYVNCGHSTPYLLRGEEEPTALTEGGPVVGILEEARFERGQQSLLPGDLLLLYTDGITESMNAQQEEYGGKRMLDVARKVRERAAKDIVREIVADVARYARQGDLHDDKIMMVVKVT